MIGVVFFYEEFFNDIILLHDATMDKFVYNCKHLGVTDIFVIDVTKNKNFEYFVNGDSEIEIQVGYESLEEIEELFNTEENSDTEFVYLENEKSFKKFNMKYKNLVDFKHPKKDVIYVAERTYRSLYGWMIDRKDKTWINIPLEDVSSDLALQLCLYDRLLKGK